MPRLDLTLLAIPAFVGAMAAELLWQRRNPAPAGTTRAGDYELADTIASLTMGVGSLVAPFVSARLLDPVTSAGRHAKVLMGTAVAASAATTVADVVRRRREQGGLPDAGTLPATDPRAPRTGPDAVPHLRDRPARPAGHRCHRGRRRRVHRPDRRDDVVGADERHPPVRGHPAGPRHRPGAPTRSRLLGWDAIYYWNHRFDRESRWLWAMHVVHHSSERYNLSTALRQPVAEGLTMSVPYGLLALIGVRPSVIENARALNLIYQFWIHTEAVKSIGWLENVLNTPSHHRVHHGVNRQYLDRNHGSILILWDRLFGTFEREDEPVVYGLTTNINTFNPVTIATHECATSPATWPARAPGANGGGSLPARAGLGLRPPGRGSSARPTRRVPSPPDVVAARAGSVSHRLVHHDPGFLPAHRG